MLFITLVTGVQGTETSDHELKKNKRKTGLLVIVSQQAQFTKGRWLVTFVKR